MGHQPYLASYGPRFRFDFAQFYATVIAAERAGARWDKIPLMKVYVAGYRPEKKEPEQIRSDDPKTDYEICYSRDPEWKMEFINQAESECRILESFGVHVGSHSCRFSVEELPEGEFAIVCLSHPDNSSASASPDPKSRLESLRAEKSATEKSLERSRVRKDYTMVADLTEYVKKLDKKIAHLEKTESE